MTTTRNTRYIDAPRAQVYATLLDADALPRWKVPDGMTAVVHEFDPRTGGAIRVSLTYVSSTEAGKSSAHTDTYRGRFAALEPNERIIEVDEFETDDPEMGGEMTITISLKDAGHGTELVAVHEGLPPGVAPADNVLGWSMSLAKLAALVEGIATHRNPA